MKLALVVAGCALLTAACTGDDGAGPDVITTVPATSTQASPPAPAPVTSTAGTTADRPTGPVDKACALLPADQLEHAFGVTALNPEEKPPKGLGVAYRHTCDYVNSSVTIALDVLFARGQGGTEKKAVGEATAHRLDVRQVPGVGTAAAYFRMETGSTSGFVAAKPLGKDSVMVILTAKAADHDGSAVTFAQLTELALDNIPA